MDAGVELGGSLKNVLAIACGISDGLGYGNNGRAALITRGLGEISRIALKQVFGLNLVETGYESHQFSVLWQPRMHGNHEAALGNCISPAEHTFSCRGPIL